MSQASKLENTANKPFPSSHVSIQAQTQKQKLTLRNASSLAPVRTQNCRDVIDYIEVYTPDKVQGWSSIKRWIFNKPFLFALHSVQWSSDSMYILCANYQRALVEVYSVADPAWQCRIDEVRPANSCRGQIMSHPLLCLQGAAGLEAACWAPDGRHILTTAEFQVRVRCKCINSIPFFFISTSVFYQLSSCASRFGRL